MNSDSSVSSAPTCGAALFQNGTFTPIAPALVVGSHSASSIVLYSAARHYGRISHPFPVPDGDVDVGPTDSNSQATQSASASAPNLTSSRDSQSGISASSTHIGQINAARRGAGTPPRPQASMSSQGVSGLNQDIMAKMKAFSLSRQGAPTSLSHAASTGTIPTSQEAGAGGALAGRMPAPRPNIKDWSSSPSVPAANASPASPRPGPPGGLAAKRQKPGLKLSDVTGGAPPSTNGEDSKPAESNGSGGGESAFSKYAEFIDTKSGTLNFKNKAILHGGGVEFSSGHSFKISLDEVERLDELGKGNYGTVYKVRHSRANVRKPGVGLSGIVSRPFGQDNEAARQDDLSGVIMAMKEIRLELDESKFAQILMELDILHQNILRKVTLSTIMGLKSLKDEHNIIHRDVKPTNILINGKGQIKICDFGVSGNLVASIAKTNIGCQSYMAPERIAGGGMQQSGTTSGGTYSVQSDIWSLGLSVIECAMGRYPYPPETFTNIFSQLHAIVHGEPPSLPESGYSEEAHAFVQACLDKNPKNRPSYNMLLRHAWLVPLMRPPTEADATEAAAVEPGQAPPASMTEDKEVADWVHQQLQRRKDGLLKDVEKPALHAVALDKMANSPTQEGDKSDLTTTE
ncbi:MAP kinase kinase PBS2 [Penicillium hetheringtonii]|uniref:mitogen-activated protein kinase kinase n=1 Tax=Penicillium hetheringtonii TaxID=911720 RepID=A0AAD6DXM4_9EURO|nr:MAP kinase kinase PBS2 [Penicillium hetheringtonii]